MQYEYSFKLATAYRVTVRLLRPRHVSSQLRSSLTISASRSEEQTFYLVKSPTLPFGLFLSLLQQSAYIFRMPALLDK